MAGWKKFSRYGACWIYKVQFNGSRCLGNSGDCQLSLIVHRSALCADFRHDDLIRIGIINPHFCDRSGDLNQTLFDCIRPHCGRDIAAVSFIADKWFIHGYLGEGIIHIRILPL